VHSYKLTEFLPMATSAATWLLLETEALTGALLVAFH
jgi:hypothetical protein